MSRPILAERISDKLKSFYRRQPPFDNGHADRARLGLEPKHITVMAAQDAAAPVESPGDADTSRGLRGER